VTRRRELLLGSARRRRREGTSRTATMIRLLSARETGLGGGREAKGRGGVVLGDVFSIEGVLL